MTEQEAATRKLFREQTTHLGDCPRCQRDRLVQTDYGLRHCECVWRPRMTSVAPSLIRGGDTVYDARLLGVDPWPLHVDRRDTGSFYMWRHMVWRTLAYDRWRAYVENRPETFTADALFTYDLQDIAFQRHDVYKTVRSLTQLPLLILLEGADPSYLRETIQQVLRSLVATRRALGRPTWLFHLDASDALFHTPILLSQGGTPPQLQPAADGSQAPALPPPANRLY